MSSLKILTAAVAAATFSLAFAQGTPPRPATNPAVGAGQRSPENTPMGDTGTPGGATGTTRGATSASGAGAATDTNTAAPSAPSAAATPSGGTAMASDTHTTHKAKAKKHHKVKKVDRN